MSVRLGVNFWQAAWLGAEEPDRLERELDQLAAVGVQDLRLLAGAEGPDDAPGRVVPSLQRAPGEWSPAIEAGMDRALAGLEARSMRAIVCLGNFWSWSGGLTQYRAWAGSGAIPTPPDGEAFRAFAAGFYRDTAARALFDAHVAHTLDRFGDAPAIAVWEILNEPRGIHDPEGMRAFLAETAGLLRRLDPTRPVATGSEGSTADPRSAGLDFAADHQDPSIGICTCHLWPENWELWDPRADDADRLGEVIAWSRAYLRRHAEIAADLGKPLLIEELGLARDERRLDAGGTTNARDRFFAAVLEEADALAAEGLPVESVLFWAWSGEGLTLAGHRRGGDPPHEPPGWYGIASSDEATLAAFQRHTRAPAPANP